MSPGSGEPTTPYLHLDLDRLDANLAGTADRARAAGVGLRPHAKTHKSPDVAARQLAAGAVGLTVATLGEAEVFADAGFDDLFVAYPLWLDADKAGRLAGLAARVALSVGVDSLEAGRRLAAAMPGLTVLIEVDSGHHRTGVPPDVTGPLAAGLADLGLDVAGVFTFPGHSYGAGRGGPAALDEVAALHAATASLAEAGLTARVVSGGSTPSLPHMDGSVLTEWRPGVYAVGDAQQWELGAMDPGDLALTCRATVVSVRGDRVVLDAGSKILGADRAAYSTGHGRLPVHPDARVVMLSEHHAVVEDPAGPVAGLGELVEVVPNHACAAINLVDVLWHREGSWPVTARGRNA